MSVNMYRNNITRLNKEKANLEKKLGQERTKIAKLLSDMSSISRSVTRITSLSTLQSKQRQLDSKQKELAQRQKNVADLETKIAKKLTDLKRNVEYFERAEAQEERKQDTVAKQRRDEELRHTKEVTREIEKQARLHTALEGSRLVIDIMQLPEKIKVLFLASNPHDQTLLQLDEEVRAITETIRASKYRDSVELHSYWAVRPPDLLKALNEHQPHVIHFSGHGSDTGEIVFYTDDGGTKLVSKEAIVTTINTMIDNIRVVVFNTCFSSGQAKAVTNYVDAAVGMNTSIGDKAARVFAAQFYSAIGFGRSIQEAFDQAKALLLLEDIPEENTPELFTREGVDPNDITLLRPPSFRG